MAKQTFTVGQVLTASEMTSLQQTAMGGGSATAKTASYTLVALDAGTVVQMNSASATTITVNTALFAAGDTVQIQNVGAGVCTVTAGTATVSTAGSLALSQYEGGQLYFNTTSAALFFDIVQSSGMTNPMTTTGDIIYSSSGSTPARLGIGTTGQVVTVASGLPSWATPSSPSFVGASVFKAATQSISNATETLITFATETYDDGNFFDSATSATKLIVPAGKGGKYLITATTTYNANSTGQRIVYMYKNGTSVNAVVFVNGGTIDTTIVSSTVLSLAATDYVELKAYQNSGGALNLLNDTTRSSFQISYLGV